MATNPFEDESAQYLVLVDDGYQYSLWPAAINPPAGWRTVFGAGDRARCLAYVEAHWTDIRPANLITGS